MLKCLKCGYEWVGRVEKPKACPECKSRLGMQKEKKEHHE